MTFADQHAIEVLARESAVRIVLGKLPPHFRAKVRIAASGCWEWIGARIGSGYGNFAQARTSVLAHRLAYETLIGPIPAELEIDHLCRNRACVNPTHLEPVTKSVNQKRGLGPERLRQQAARITHCPQGHPYSGSNLYVWPRNGHRHCKACLRAKDRARYQSDPERFRREARERRRQKAVAS